MSFLSFLSFPTRCQKQFTLLLSTPLQAKYHPVQLKRLISTTSGYQLFIKQLSIQIKGKKQQVQFGVIKRLALMHHLVFYHQEYAKLSQQVLLDRLVGGEDTYLNLYVIRPYVAFIRKLCCSIDAYKKAKSMPCGQKKQIFQSMYYSINLLKSLFVPVNKLQSLGRYFRQSSPQCLDYFISLISFQCQKIYTCFRQCLNHLITYSTLTSVDQTILKQIISHDLSQINEEMKKIFLDKYFYPYGKGYGIKLYKVQELQGHTAKIARGILTGHQQTNRQRQYYTLEQTLFPLNQKFNAQIFEQSFDLTLQQSKLQHLKISLQRKRSLIVPSVNKTLLQNPQRDRQLQKRIPSNQNTSLPCLLKKMSQKITNFTSIQQLQQQTQQI